MSNTKTENQLLESLRKLTLTQRQSALSYIKELSNQDKASTDHNRLLQFVGIFSQTDLKEITSAIESDCNYINQNEW